jgi:gliding motility-associated-like protein
MFPPQTEMVLMTPGMFGNALASPNLYIYDDIAKLFKQLTLTQNGWDGTFFNGPFADDYWFYTLY